MATKKCPNGHQFDSSIYGDSCPWCEEEETEIIHLNTLKKWDSITKLVYEAQDGGYGGYWKYQISITPFAKTLEIDAEEFGSCSIVSIVEFPKKIIHFYNNALDKFNDFKEVIKASNVFSIRHRHQVANSSYGSRLLIKSEDEVVWDSFDDNHGGELHSIEPICTLFRKQIPDDANALILTAQTINCAKI